MEACFAAVPGIGGASHHTSEAPVDYGNAIGVGGVLEIFVVWGGLILIAAFILSIFSAQKRRHRKLRTLN
jgi:hypothetical protein